MNNVSEDDFVSVRLDEIFDSYKARLSSALQSIDREKLLIVFELLKSVRADGHCVFVAGNGGSAASASHFCCDLSYGGRNSSNVNLKTVSLVDNVALLTALSNDFSYREAIALEVDRLANPSDLLILISASGNSPNVVSAMEAAQNKGVKVIAFTGFDGGELAKKADVAIHVATNIGDYGVVEDVHMMLNHILVLALRDS